MGLSNFPSAADGVLPVIIMNTVMSVSILKNLLKSTLRLIVAAPLNSSGSNLVEEEDEHNESDPSSSAFEQSPLAGTRRVSITQFKILCQVELARRREVEEECCSVCLCKFEEKDEVSELSCKHFFHRHCLDKWFNNQHSTCPLCRSIDD